MTGSIACYKVADLASKLTQAGAEVDVILTESATYFVHPITFQSVTGRKAYTEKDLSSLETVMKDIPYRFTHFGETILRVIN